MTASSFYLVVISILLIFLTDSYLFILNNELNAGTCFSSWSGALTHLECIALATPTLAPDSIAVTPYDFSDNSDIHTSV